MQEHARGLNEAIGAGHFYPPVHAAVDAEYLHEILEALLLLELDKVLGPPGR